MDDVLITRRDFIIAASAALLTRGLCAALPTTQLAAQEPLWAQDSHGTIFELVTDAETALTHLEVRIHPAAYNDDRVYEAFMYRPGTDVVCWYQVFNSCYGLRVTMTPFDAIKGPLNLAIFPALELGSGDTIVVSGSLYNRNNLTPTKWFLYNK